MPLHLIDSLLRWLQEHFKGGSPPDATDEVVQPSARAHIFSLFSSALSINKLGEVRIFSLPLPGDFEEAESFSWSSVILASLYHELYHVKLATSNQIASHLVLLQVSSLFVSNIRE